MARTGFDATSMSVLSDELDAFERGERVAQATDSQVGIALRFGDDAVLDKGRWLEVNEPSSSPPPPPRSSLEHVEQGTGVAPTMVNVPAPAPVEGGYGGLAAATEGDVYDAHSFGDGAKHNDDEDEDEDEEGHSDSVGEEEIGEVGQGLGRQPSALSVVSEMSDVDDAAIMALEQTEKADVIENIKSMAKALTFELPPDLLTTASMATLRQWQRTLQTKKNAKAWADKRIHYGKVGCKMLKNATKLLAPFIGDVSAATDVFANLEELRKPLEQVACHQPDINVPRTPMQEVQDILVHRVLDYVSGESMGQLTGIITGHVDSAKPVSCANPFETITPEEIRRIAAKETSIHDNSDLLPGAVSHSARPSATPYPKAANVANAAAAYDSETESDSDDEPGPTTVVTTSTRPRVPPVPLRPVPTEHSQARPMAHVQPATTEAQAQADAAVEARFHRMKELDAKLREKAEMQANLDEQLLALQTRVAYTQEQLDNLVSRRKAEESKATAQVTNGRPAVFHAASVAGEVPATILEDASADEGESDDSAEGGDDAHTSGSEDGESSRGNSLQDDSSPSAEDTASDDNEDAPATAADEPEAQTQAPPSVAAHTVLPQPRVEFG